MKESHRQFDEITDVYAFKVVVDTTDNCYKALGLVHRIFKPVESRFKDYISIPKSNGYQSIHTGVVGLEGKSIEIQIKTEEMNELAENGIASHWLYKAGEKTETNTQKKARRWVADLLEMRSSVESSEDFVQFCSLMENKEKLERIKEDINDFILKQPRAAEQITQAIFSHD